MPRLLGVDIPGEKRIEASLPYIYGIGPNTAKRMLEQANIDPNIRAKDLTPGQISDIISRDHVEQAPHRGRPAPRTPGQPEASPGDQLLPWHPPSSRVARARPAHLHQRPHPQGTAQDRRRATQQGRQAARPRPFARILNQHFSVWPTKIKHPPTQPPPTFPNRPLLPPPRAAACRRAR